MGPENGPKSGTAFGMIFRFFFQRCSAKSGQSDRVHTKFDTTHFPEDAAQQADSAAHRGSPTIKSKSALNNKGKGGPKGTQKGGPKSMQKGAPTPVLLGAVGLTPKLGSRKRS